jgi:hypothetical protein
MEIYLAENLVDWLSGSGPGDNKSNGNKRKSKRN